MVRQYAGHSYVTNYLAGFAVQAILLSAVGLAFLIGPALVADPAFHFFKTQQNGMLRWEAITAVLPITLVFSAIFGITGLVCLWLNPLWVRAANISLSRDMEVVRLKLHYRNGKPKRNLYGSDEFDAELTLADGVKKTVRFLSRCGDLSTLVGLEVQADLYHDLLDNRAPLVLGIEQGLLLEQPNEARLIGAANIGSPREPRQSRNPLQVQACTQYIATVLFLAASIYWIWIMHADNGSVVYGPATQLTLQIQLACLLGIGLVSLAIAAENKREAMSQIKLRCKATLVRPEGSWTFASLFFRNLCFNLTCGEDLAVERKDVRFSSLMGTRRWPVGETNSVDLYLNAAGQPLLINTPEFTAVRHPLLLSSLTTVLLTMFVMGLFCFPFIMINEYYGAEVPSAADAETYFRYGKMFTSCGRRDEAKICLMRAVEKNPNSEVATNARAFMNANLPPSKVHPTALALFYNTGLRLKPEEQTKRMRRCLAIDPTFSWPYATLGRLQLRQGNLNEAVRLYEQCLSSSPNYKPALIALSELYRLQGRTDDGRKLLGRAWDNRNYDNTLVTLSVAYEYKELGRKLVNCGTANCLQDKHN